jgi:hypothetical protein
MAVLAAHSQPVSPRNFAKGESAKLQGKNRLVRPESLCVSIACMDFSQLRRAGRNSFIAGSETISDRKSETSALRVKADLLRGRIDVR